MTIKKENKKHFKVHPLNFAPQVWTLCHCQTLWKLTLSEEECPSEITNQDGHCHGYALFPFSA